MSGNLTDMKTSADILLEEVADDFNQFLMYGNLSSFTQKIEPNLNIDNLAKLLRIHYVLTMSKDGGRVGVIDFVEQLTERLRRIKTTVKKETERFEGEVKGRINWKHTIRDRYNRNPKDRSSFICDKREINYDIAENLVLKSLLQIIHNIIYYDLNVAFENRYKWLKGWVEEKGLKEILNQLFFRNVYLKRINLSESAVTERMINKSSKSRSALYREAAELLARYRKLMTYELDSSEAKELLNNTFIEPDKADTLFELYWIIKIIKQFKNPKFHLIERGTNIVASWEIGQETYKIFHDSVGSFEFNEDIDKISRSLIDKDNFLGRELKVLGKIEQLTGKKADNLWGGRPDIILEKHDKDGRLVSIFIGEVKYTQDRGYAIQGLKELLEYMALIKKNGTYVEKYKHLFDGLIKIKGCLFLDSIDDEDLNIKRNDDTVQIVMFGEDMNILADF
jgi:hypothetical protein